MLKKVIILISACFFLHASHENSRGLKSELLQAVSQVKPIQDIIWGYLNGWDAEHTITRTKELEYDRLAAIVCSPKGKYIAVLRYLGDEEPAIIKVDVQTNKIDTITLTRDVGEIQSPLAISPDGAFFLFCTGSFFVYFFNTANGDESTSLYAGNRTDSACYSRNGSYLLLKSGTVIKIVSCGFMYRDLKVLTTHPWRMFLRSEYASENLCSPDEKNIVSLDYDRVQIAHETIGKAFSRLASLKIWDIHTGTVVQEIEDKAMIVACWSPDSNYIATATPGGSIKIWKKQHGKFVLDKTFASCDESISSSVKIAGTRLVWSHDSKYIFFLQTQNSALKIIELKTGECVDKIDNVMRFCYAPEEKIIAAITSNYEIKIYRNQVVDLEVIESQQNKSVSARTDQNISCMNKLTARLNSTCVIS